MQTREQILSANPIVPFLERRGIKLRGTGKQRLTNVCAGTTHKPDHLCVAIETEKQVWFCNDCKRGGSVIDWLMIQENQSAAAVLASLQQSIPTPPSGRPRIAALYDYVNESGEMVYQAVRLDPKSFRQRRPDGRGGWLWDMEGVTRILFNLPAIVQAKTVAICEGEKDCLTAGRFDLVATCNVGGAGKWLDAYAPILHGKDVLIFPDMDEPGRKHGESILASLSGVANSIKLVLVPKPYKDLTEFVESFPDIEQSKRELLALIDRTAHIVKPPPLYSIQEMEAAYMLHRQRSAERSFNLSKFLPALGELIDPMLPGEMMLVLADTGVGKTMILQNMIRAAAPLPSLLFELELPLLLLFERFVQMEMRAYRSQVQVEYLNQVAPLWKGYRGLHHITVCPESGLTVDEIERYIVKSELKTGVKPAIVAVDYVSLIRNLSARGRYEAVSNTAEQLKVVAKRTNVIMLVASQIARPDKKKDADISVGLHDAKDSGSLENSAGLVLGAWRPEKSRLMLKILKNTSGTSGQVIEAKVDGERMMIT